MLAVPSSGEQPHPRASFVQTGVPGHTRTPNVERSDFPVCLMISRFLSQTLRMRAMRFRVWERSTCVPTDLDAKGKGAIIFGCPASTNRGCGPEVMLIQKAGNTLSVTRCTMFREDKAVQQSSVCPHLSLAMLTLKQARPSMLARGKRLC